MYMHILNIFLILVREDKLVGNRSVWLVCQGNARRDVLLF